MSNSLKSPKQKHSYWEDTRKETGIKRMHGPYYSPEAASCVLLQHVWASNIILLSATDSNFMKANTVLVYIVNVIKHV